MIIAATLLGSWPEYQYYLKAVQKLYTVKTKQAQEFRKTKAIKYENKWAALHNNLRNHKNKHILGDLHEGKLNMSTEVCLYIQKCFNCLSYDVTELKSKAARWFVIGKERFDRELNIEKVLKHIRNFECLALKDEKVKAALELERQNIIEVDSDDLKAKDSALDVSDDFQPLPADTAINLSQNDPSIIRSNLIPAKVNKGFNQEANYATSVHKTEDQGSTF